MSIHSYLVRLGAACALSLICLTAATVRAQGDGDYTTESLARVLPYDGYLDVFGSPAQGEFEVEFELRRPNSDDGDLTWSEIVTVNAIDGQFSTLLGVDTPIPDALLASGEALELVLTLRLCDDEPCEPQEIELSPLEITPAPFALWSLHSDDITAQTINVEGQLTAPAIDFEGDVAFVEEEGVGGSVSAGSVAAATLVVPDDADDSTGFVATGNVVVDRIDADRAIIDQPYRITYDVIKRLYYDADGAGAASSPVWVASRIGTVLDLVNQGAFSSGLGIGGDAITFTHGVTLNGTRSLHSDSELRGRDGNTTNWSIASYVTALEHVDIPASGSAIGSTVFTPDEWTCFVGGFQWGTSTVALCDTGSTCNSNSPAGIAESYAAPTETNRWEVHSTIRHRQGRDFAGEALMVCVDNDIVSYSGGNPSTWFQ